MNQLTYQKRIILILSAAALVFTLSGCKKQPSPPPEEQTSPPSTAKETPHTVPQTMVIEPGVGIGPIKFGMTKEDLIKNLGEPDKIEGNGVGLNYVSSKGLSFLVHPVRGVQAIDCWSKEYPFPFATITTFTGKTKEGIGMGASREQIEAAYERPDQVTTQGPLTTLRYNKLQMHFMLMQGKLVSIKMEAPK